MQRELGERVGEIEIDLNDVVRSTGQGKWRGLNSRRKCRVKCLLSLTGLKGG